MGKIKEMIGLGVEFWNDSCDVGELLDAIGNGAVGATSNPVIVSTVVAEDASRWTPCIQRIARENRGLSDEELAWRCVDAVAIEASRVLLPVYERTEGAKGFLNVQVDPAHARDVEKMIAHARRLASLAPNIAVKIPLTQAGLVALEELAAEGIRTNATVSFSVAQALAAAEATERGLARRRERGTQIPPRFTAYVTIMVGRVADHLKRVQDAEVILADPGTTDWAGVAVFKRAWALFRERGFASALVAAAYRHRRQWSELVGEGVIQSIPYAWWRAFDASAVRLERTIAEPINPLIVDELRQCFPDFVRAYEPDGMRPAEFERYGASVATLRQFELGARALVERVRALREEA